MSGAMSERRRRFCVGHVRERKRTQQLSDLFQRVLTLNV